MDRVLGLRIFRDHDGGARVIVVERTVRGRRKRQVYKRPGQKMVDLQVDQTVQTIP